LKGFLSYFSKIPVEKTFFNCADYGKVVVSAYFCHKEEMESTGNLSFPK
jgi:hypothetical protein